MLSKETYREACEKVCAFLRKAGIAFTVEEKERLEVADFGLNDLEHIGLQVLTYINTSRVCAKEMVLFPGQTCPEHKHPPIGGADGKEETFRCRWGKVHLFVEGEPARLSEVCPPETGRAYYSAMREVILLPGEQYTIDPNTLHWFQAGKEGAVVSEFSTTSVDEGDIFTDPNVRRIPEVEE